MQNAPKADKDTTEQVNTSLAILQKKPTKIIAILYELPLPPDVEEHFQTKTVAYLWENKPRNTSEGEFYMGIWMTDEFDYTPVVLARDFVRDYIIDSIWGGYGRKSYKKHRWEYKMTETA